jgi:hypothetical protein
MYQFEPINGWTKLAIIKMIQDNFTVKSQNDKGECAYRGLNGSKCVVGCFIPDGEYHPEMDNLETCQKGTDIESVLGWFPDLIQFMPLELVALQKLQGIHDGNPSQYGLKESRTDTEIKAQLIQWVNDYVS